MSCKHCYGGKLSKTGDEIFCEFTEPVHDRAGVVYHPAPFIFKRNNRYFLSTEVYDYEIKSCPICGDCLPSNPPTIMTAEEYDLFKKGENHD